jgi:7TMR-DISM extracellular 2
MKPLIKVSYNCILALSLAIVPYLSIAQNSTVDQVTYSIYEDKSGKLSFNDVSDPGFAANFSSLETNSVWHEPTESSIWVRFKVSNVLNAERFMELNRPNLGEVIYHQPSTTGV